MFPETRGSNRNFVIITVSLNLEKILVSEVSEDNARFSESWATCKRLLSIFVCDYIIFSRLKILCLFLEYIKYLSGIKPARHARVYILLYTLLLSCDENLNNNQLRNKTDPNDFLKKKKTDATNYY